MWHPESDVQLIFFSHLPYLKPWPFHTIGKDLKGLPPHIIINDETDLIRDAGAVFVRKLQALGVSAIAKTIDGSPHVMEIAMPDLVPELVQDTVGSLTEFARTFS